MVAAQSEDAAVIHDALGQVEDAGSRLRQLAESAVAGKKAKGKKADDGTVEARKAVLQLRAQSRLAFLRADRLAEEMEDAKKRAEVKELSLQNLSYEKSYLSREIIRCLAFETEQVDSVPLVPESEFFSGAPRHLLEDLETLEKGSSAYDHQKQLSRLSHEILLRRNLTDQKQELLDKIKQVRKEISGRRSFLQDLPNKMQSVVASMGEIQKAFGQPIIERLGRHEKSRNLPDALYMIECQLEAYDDSFGGVAVTVETNENYQSQARGSGRGGGGEGGKDGGAEEEEEEDEEDQAKQSNTSTSGKRKGKRTRDKMEGVNGESGKVGSKKRKGAEGQISMDQKPSAADGAQARSVLQTNGSDTFVDCGWVVKAVLQSPHKQVQVTLVFLYYEAQNVVTVQAVDREGLLANIFPNDTGRFLPHIRMDSSSTNSAVVSKNSRVPFPEHLVGRPFKWLQWLAGIYNMPLDRDNQAPPSTQKIVKAILDRVGAQESLSEQLLLLSKKPHPVPVHASAQHLFPSSAKTKLSKWEEITPAEADKQCVDAVVQRAAGIPTFYRSQDAKNADKISRASDWANFGRRCFHGVLLLPNKKKVEVIVQVYVDYPRRAPRFTLFPTKDEVLETVQREVNEYPEELYAGDRLSLLSHQLRRLQMCLDVYAAAGDTQVEGSTLESQTSLNSSNERKHRGRDRRLAFVFESASRSFVHR